MRDSRVAVLTEGPSHSDADWAWALVLGANRVSRGVTDPTAPASYAIDPAGALKACDGSCPAPVLVWRPETGWFVRGRLSGPAQALLDLYLPLCRSPCVERLVIGHLGQSLDGCIATDTGDACFVTGKENIVHLHRMRALSDAVIVGAETVSADDPRLTTRLVPGDNPARVVLDPRRRLHTRYGLFCDDAAPTLLFCCQTRAQTPDARHGRARVIGVTCHDGRLDLDEVLQRLADLGYRSSFIEGGGVTVSAFAQAGLLDRLQIAVAPVVIGRGRPGLQLPRATTMGECLRPRHRIFRMGDDMLFDCEPAVDGRDGGSGESARGIERVL